MRPFNVRRFLWALFAGLAFLTLLEWVGMQRVIHQHEEILARHLGKATLTLIDKAKAAHDDLIIQQAIQALASAPGVKAAAVVDADGKFFAHSDPTRLGQSFRVKKQRELWRFPLQKDPASGFLLLKMSDPRFRRSSQSNFGLRVLGMVVIGLFLAYWAIRMKRGQDQREQQMADQTSLLEETRHRLKRKESEADSINQLWKQRTQQMANRFSYPAFLLDSQQRLAGWNQQAESFMQGTSLGMSWHEVPFFQNLGSALEQSLATPGQPISVEGKNPHLELLSFQDEAKHLAGTWIFGVERLL